MNISKAINEHMQQKGLTIYRLAKESGLNYSALYLLINDSSRDARISTLIKIADALDISLDEFR